MPAPLPFAAPDFARELARLNARQREAVTHPDGPVLVVAGPGTGKTQLLAARVAWLLTQPDVRPQEILCLTYTDAAARNMRQRLLRFVGPLAHQVAIHTFHSLGQLIIQENADQVGYHDLTVASDLERDEVMRHLLDALPAGHPLRRDTGDAYYEARRLMPLFADLKREGWTPAQVLHELETHRLGLPDDPAYQYRRANPAQGIRAGDVNHGKLAAEEARLAKTAAAVELFEPYQHALRQRQRFDYEDMLAWALGLLRQHEAVRLRYQERFQHFLVDEFQDTNGVQAELLYLLADYWPNPSVLAVGDDDQSIFRFQGASVANVWAFVQHYPTAHVVVLEENYRSSGLVLAAATALVGHNRERLVHQLPNLQKELLARHPRFAGSGVVPRLRRYPTPLHEAAHLAQELAALHKSGWPAGGAAVLAHDHGQLDTLARLLTAAQVPFQRKRQVNVLADEPLATALLRVLRYLAESLLPHPTAAEGSLFAVLHLDCLGVPPEDLVRLAAGHLAHRRSALAAGKPPRPWRAWAARAAHDETWAELVELSAAGRPKLQQALGLLDEWVQAAASQPLPAVLELVCLGTLLPWQLTHSARPTQPMAVAHTLLAWGRNEARRQPGLSVAGLVRTWEALGATRDGLPLEQLLGPDEAGLHLLTAHGAKGLEWERVWVLGCQQSKWLKTYRAPHFELPPGLLTAPATDPETAETEEARRLFFVALTRAQEHLTLSFADADDTGKDQVECQFISELSRAAGLPIETVAVAPALLEAARRQLLAPSPPAAPRLPREELAEVLADFALSITTLNAYLACPVACYYEQILRAPVPRTDEVHLGQAAHKALELLFRQARQQPEQPFGSADELAATFAARFGRRRAELAPAAFERTLHAGQRQLRHYHTQRVAEWRPTALVEHVVRRAVLPDGLVLTGQLDRLDPHPDGLGCDVVDYKTGNPAQATDDLRPALGWAARATLAEWRADARLRGGDYWRQAVFYHLLLTYDQDQRFRPAALHFDFLQPREQPGRSPELVRHTYHVTPAEQAIVLAQAHAVDAAIRAHEFEQGCGQCHWCRLRGAG